VAAVVERPGREPSEDRPSRDLEEAFAERYVLITPENVEDIVERRPALLSPNRPARTAGRGSMSP
jgi:hypothetical protein